VHFESYVFDFSPLGEPIIQAPESEQAMTDALGNGRGRAGALAALTETRLRQVERDAAVRELVRGVWRSSGLNGVPGSDRVARGGHGLPAAERQSHATRRPAHARAARRTAGR
jgi:hypothetical protein